MSIIIFCFHFLKEMLSEQQSEFRQPIIYLKDVSFSNLTALVDVYHSTIVSIYKFC